MMKMKNIVEGMGIGLFFDGFAYTLGKGSKKAVKQIQDRNKSLKQSTVQNWISTATTKVKLSLEQIKMHLYLNHIKVHTYQR